MVLVRPAPPVPAAITRRTDRPPPGAFTAIVPAFEDGTTTAAAADGPYDAFLAADSTALEAAAPGVSVVPVELAAEDVSAEDHLARVVQAAELA